MDRRTFLAGAGALAVAGVAGGHAAAHAASSTGVTQPLVLWSTYNATVAPGYSALRQVPLAVYPDGTAIADTSLRATVDARNLRTLGTLAASILKVAANGKPGPHALAGAATTQFDAWNGGHHYRIVAPGLSDEGYPEPLYTLLHALTKQHTEVVAHGTAYAPAAVRLWAVADRRAGASVPAWPASVPVPAIKKGDTWTQVDLIGAKATVVAAGLPRTDPSDWTGYRLPDGSGLTVTWRRLLPHELIPVRLL